jgi:hypothetical protein
MLGLLRGFLVAIAMAGCGSQQAAAITFDPCNPVRVSGVDGVADAIAMWRAQDVTPFSIAEPPDVRIELATGAPAIYGFYDDTTATVYVNTTITDAHERSVTIAHELGHALGLVHVPASERASVMNPGNLTVEPTAEDAAMLPICPSRSGSAAAR